MPMRLSSAFAAERMRLYRRRRREGVRPVTVEIPPMLIEALVKRRYLKPQDRGDLSELQFAVRAFLSDQLMAPEQQ
jgi:hypothetical protein